MISETILAVWEWFNGALLLVTAGMFCSAIRKQRRKQLVGDAVLVTLTCLVVALVLSQMTHDVLYLKCHPVASVTVRAR